MSTQAGRVMKRKNPYLMMDVTSLRDKNLSFKAKGLMTYFLDKPDDWIFRIKSIFDASTDGEVSVRAGLKELQKNGYLVRVAFRRDKKVDRYEFLIYEQPVSFPQEKPIHVDLEAWEEHLKTDGTLDITLFVRNLNSGNENSDNLNSAKGGGLISTNITKELKSPIIKQQQKLEKRVVVREKYESLFEKKLTKKQAMDLISLADKHEVDVLHKIQNTYEMHVVEPRKRIIGAIKYAIENGDWEISRKTKGKKKVSTLPKAVSGQLEVNKTDAEELEIKKERVAKKLAEMEARRQSNRALSARQ